MRLLSWNICRPVPLVRACTVGTTMTALCVVQTAIRSNCTTLGTRNYRTVELLYNCTRPSFLLTSAPGCFLMCGTCNYPQSDQQKRRIQSMRINALMNAQCAFISAFTSALRIYKRIYKRTALWMRSEIKL